MVTMLMWAWRIGLVDLAAKYRWPCGSGGERAVAGAPARGPGGLRGRLCGWLGGFGLRSGPAGPRAVSNSPNPAPSPDHGQISAGVALICAGREARSGFGDLCTRQRAVPASGRLGGAGRLWVSGRCGCSVGLVAAVGVGVRSARWRKVGAGVRSVWVSGRLGGGGRCGRPVGSVAAVGAGASHGRAGAMTDGRHRHRPRTTLP